MFTLHKFPLLYVASVINICFYIGQIQFLEQNNTDIFSWTFPNLMDNEYHMDIKTSLSRLILFDICVMKLINITFLQTVNWFKDIVTKKETTSNVIYQYVQFLTNCWFIRFLLNSFHNETDLSYIPPHISHAEGW